MHHAMKRSHRDPVGKVKPVPPGAVPAVLIIAFFLAVATGKACSPHNAERDRDGLTFCTIPPNVVPNA
jgi:hypothetical protein